MGGMGRHSQTASLGSANYITYKATMLRAAVLHEGLFGLPRAHFAAQWPWELHQLPPQLA